MSDPLSNLGWFGPWAMLLTLLYVAVSAFIAALSWRPDSRRKLAKAPRAAVLVAARNEERHLAACLDSLLTQNYPPEALEILVGDDGSTDGTSAIARQYAERNARIRVLRVEDQLPGLQGKQNVLAQLARLTDAPVLLFADADVVAPPDWAATHAAALVQTTVGMTSAPSIVKETGMWSALQALDWLVGTSTLAVGDRIDRPMTAIGNNMGITREAYDSVGGYESLPFSITEDFGLFVAVREWNYPTLFIWNPAACSDTWAAPSLPELIHQRRRWLRGGLSGPWYAVAAYSLYQAAPWAALLHWAFGPPDGNGLSLVLLIVAADFAVCTAAALALGRLRLLRWFPLYVPYRLGLQVLVGGSMLLRRPVRWKGRLYG